MKIRENDRFRQYDDLYVLEFLLLYGLFRECDCHKHVQSEMRINEVFLPKTILYWQENCIQIALWTEENFIKIIEKKTSYIGLLGPI